MRRRALIFADQADARRLMWSILNRRGYDVFSYLNPSVCPLSNIDRCPCPEGAICADVIISDVQMSRANGIDFVRQLIEKKCKHPHIAVISGNWTEPDMRRARQFGCKIFEKPLAILKLIEWLDEIEATIPRERCLFDLASSSGFQVSPFDALGRHLKR